MSCRATVTRLPSMTLTTWKRTPLPVPSRLFSALISVSPLLPQPPQWKPPPASTTGAPSPQIPRRRCPRPITPSSTSSPRRTLPAKCPSFSFSLVPTPQAPPPSTRRPARRFSTIPRQRQRRPPTRRHIHDHAHDHAGHVSSTPFVWHSRDGHDLPRPPPSHSRRTLSSSSSRTGPSRRRSPPSTRLLSRASRRLRILLHELHRLVRLPARVFRRRAP